MKVVEKLDTLRASLPDGDHARLPNDLDALKSFLQTCNAVLEMLASRVEPDWEDAQRNFQLLEELCTLQDAIISKAASHHADSPEEIAAKLDIWRLSWLSENGAKAPHPRDRLVLSALGDLTRE